MGNEELLTKIFTVDFEKVFWTSNEEGEAVLLVDEPSKTEKKDHDKFHIVNGLAQDILSKLDGVKSLEVITEEIISEKNIEQKTLFKNDSVNFIKTLLDLEIVCE